MARFATTEETVDTTSRKPSFTRTGQTKAAQSRTNKYPGRCDKCDGWVPAETGLLVGAPGNWSVQHKNCDAVVSGAPEPERVEFKVPDGTYTIIAEGFYKTIRVRTQSEDSSFKPGAAILAYLSGPNNEADYTSFANSTHSGGVYVWKGHQGNATLREAVKVLLGDPKAAAVAYGQESGTCAVCGRTLTTPESLARGMGSTCASRFA